MLIATANIRNRPDMPRPWVVDDAEGIRSVVDLAGCQEIGEVQDHQDLLTGLGAHWEEVLGGLSQADCDNPIVFNTEAFTLRGQGSFLLHTHKDFPSAVDRDKYAVWGDFERVGRPDLVVRLVNTHNIAQVYGPGDEKRPDHNTRRRIWNQDYDRVEKFIKESVKDGHPTILVGDMNQGDRWKVPAGGTLAFGPGIEKISLHPAGDVTFEVRDSGSLNGHSDHPVRWARVYGVLPQPVEHKCPSCGDVHTGIVSD